jgi:hypothetical protein
MVDICTQLVIDHYHYPPFVFRIWIVAFADHHAVGKIFTTKIYYVSHSHDHTSEDCLRRGQP